MTIQQVRFFIIIILAIGVSSYDLTISFFGFLAPAISIEKKTTLILLLLTLFVTDTTLMLRSILTSFDFQFVPKNSKSLPIVKLLSSELNDQINGINNKRVIYQNRYDSMAAWIKLMDNCTKSYEGLNFYFRGNEKLALAMEDLLMANIDAVKRGVKVRRYFIIPVDDAFKNSCEELKIEMEKQNKQGIEIYFILASDLKHIKFFRHRTIKPAGWCDDQVLAVDLSRAEYNSSPEEIVVTWDQDEINKINPFPHLKGNSYVKKWPEDKHIIEALLE
ncbi:MAG: hypothetical protein AB4057_21545 [Crocosphaera sp.]